MQHITLNNVVRGHRDINPNNETRSKVTALVPVEELKKLNIQCIPWCNPRVGFTAEVNTDKSRVAKDIRNSLDTKDGGFHERHRGGVSLIADSASIDGGKLFINFGKRAVTGNDPENYRGLGDGGTTVRVCAASEFVQDPANVQYVSVQVYSGDYGREEVSTMVEAWNTNLQVDAFSMANQRGDFKPIIETLEKKTPGQKPFPKVSYHFGDTGEYDIREIIQFVSLFAMENPKQAYAGVAGCLNMYLNGGEFRVNFDKILPLIHDIVRLYEKIALELPDLYNAEGRRGKDGGKFRLLGFIKDKTFRLPYLGEDITYSPDKSYMFPLLASFRAVLNTSGPVAKWATDPEKLLRKVVGPMFVKVLDNATPGFKDMSAVGRNDALYGLLESVVTKATR